MWKYPIKNYQAWTVKPEQFPYNGNLVDHIHFLLRYAILAPSSHNSQPWRFFVSANSLDISFNEKRLLPVSDPLNRLAYIALGCALQNIRIAADYFGLQMVCMYLPNGEIGSPAVHIQFSTIGKGKKDVTHLIHAIPERRSNRMPYTPKPIPDLFLHKLRELSFGQNNIFCTTTVEMRNHIADVLMKARLTLFDHVPFRVELAGYKRHNLTRLGTGMPGFTMGFPLLMSFVAPWAVRKFNVIKLLQEKEERLLREQSPCFLIFGTKEDMPHHWVKSGECLQKILLEAERAGIHSSISVFPRTSDALAVYRSVAPTGYSPHMFCRLGFSHERPRHSPRLLPEEL
ncbi:MAG TPA: hypothetical protein DCY48_03035 [Candidatus Magasanikbacteria bacterium]|nr:MAG: hypothetical protein A3I74_05215 [Candidatus Magasanikbacteria bacterium RIFCSPLOWO2_02_FULL_47_16]OGH79415.1 MAG: hypothetical protein A3C10_05050 [Candidatus Magasanikbacteria bacterium RIFCSPHIGHO2_02_FULL_48_18]OGH83106.1 MAG: hypothetical protein A3G08_01760 [Candidatus Magasanikbacteria bacterium RIFCSPLOWO2_12_FULL_47_9b]HAZ28724.1 hypothetical protein [Candidatus Magasanikbacteria bacterium]